MTPDEILALMRLIGRQALIIDRQQARIQQLEQQATERVDRQEPT